MSYISKKEFLVESDIRSNSLWKNTTNSFDDLNNLKNKSIFSLKKLFNKSKRNLYIEI